MPEDQYSGLSWMTEEMKKAIHHRDRIVKDHDINGLFQLTDNSDFSIALSEIISNKCDYKPDTLNHTQRVLFFCIQLENAGQADSILGFLRDYPQWTYEAVNALKEIGATKSAEIIKQAVELLPKDGTWFLDTADAHSRKLMKKLDTDFALYPDGLMPDLYRKYADNHRGDF
jgi:hypothetical protein